MHRHPDTHWHSYLMKTDICIHPACAFGIEGGGGTAILENIYCMTGAAYYQVNADWLYLTCSTSESQIANLKSKMYQEEFKTQSADKCGALHYWNDSLFTGQRCVPVPPSWCVYWQFPEIEIVSVPDILLHAVFSHSTTHLQVWLRGAAFSRSPLSFGGMFNTIFALQSACFD